MLLTIGIMSNPKSLTQLLQESLADAESLRAVARETGLDVAQLSRFKSGQRTLRLDIAERLAEYFGIESRRINRRRRG